MHCNYSGAQFTKCLKICPKIIVRSIAKSVISSPLVILYDLSYNYRNCVLTLSYNNPKINLVVDDHKIICTSGACFVAKQEANSAINSTTPNLRFSLPLNAAIFATTESLICPVVFMQSSSSRSICILLKDEVVGISARR